jgi:hypothetical protein
VTVFGKSPFTIPASSSFVSSAADTTIASNALTMPASSDTKTVATKTDVVISQAVKANVLDASESKTANTTPAPSTKTCMTDPYARQVSGEDSPMDA